jgi:hypothetical protein
MKMSTVASIKPCSGRASANLGCTIFLAAGLLAASLLGGCSERSANELSPDAARVDKGLAAALKSINGAGDPMAAFLAVRAAKKTACPRDGLCDYYLPSWEQANKDQVAYLGRAIAKGDPRAFNVLYVAPNKIDELDAARLNAENADRFLAYAEQLHAANEAEGALLRKAADIVVDGNLVVRDTGWAVNLLARSWAAGDKQSASTAAWVFVSVNDYRNAYMWSLRCTAGCSRDYNVQLDDLQRRLSAEDVRRAQKAAQDQSVIELDTTGQ